MLPFQYSYSFVPIVPNIIINDMFDNPVPKFYGTKFFNKELLSPENSLKN